MVCELCRICCTYVHTCRGISAGVMLSGTILYMSSYVHIYTYHIYICPSYVSLVHCRGVLESLIKKHFPSSDQKKMSGGFDLDLFSDDPTLPLSLRKRLREDGES